MRRRCSGSPHSASRFWLLDEDTAEGRTVLRRAALDGSGVDAVTVGTYLPDTEIRNESVPKLYQFAAGGSPDDPGTRKGRVSCNRGEQSSAAAVAGSQVVWLDSTTGVTDVVTRTRPTGRCG
ncbi:hypothetical protein [Streptomyces phaeochromogenes]